MAAKRFHIETPDQLRELSELTKEHPNGLEHLIRVWTATKRKQGKTNWDNKFFACFSGTRDRISAIVHFNSQGELTHSAPIQYNKALNWCESHLKEVYD